tara:strand:- start:133 stop:423 length:291 start_codon:yes stop_codon:yes gene_type:complete
MLQTHLAPAREVRTTSSFSSVSASPGLWRFSGVKDPARPGSAGSAGSINSAVELPYSLDDDDVASPDNSKWSSSEADGAEELSARIASMMSMCGLD